MEYTLELNAVQSGYSIVCGVDEAGCGPLAGPVFAAAVVLDLNNPVLGLDDSKKLSDKKRRMLFEEIKEKAVAFSISSVSEKEIDRINILEARLLAMRLAIENLNIKPDIALIDGNRDPKANIQSVLIIKGDSKSPSIAAASILAKVSRDDYMTALAGDYPLYYFEKHKGYPTKLHYQCLKDHGPCDAHRLSFLKNLGSK